LRTDQFLEPEEKIYFITHKTFLAQGRQALGKDFAVMHNDAGSRLLPRLL